MAIELPKAPLSYDDYAAIDDDQRYEVLDGELVLMSSPSLRHQAIAMELSQVLANYVHETRQGRVFAAPCDVVLKAGRPAIVLQPDLLYVSAGRAGVLTPANIQGAPDLAVEVLSPSNARKDTIRKLALYARYGVPELWFISHEFDEIKVLRLDAATGRFGKPAVLGPDDVLTSPLLPGFTLAVSELFADLGEGEGAE